MNDRRTALTARRGTLALLAACLTGCATSPRSDRSTAASPSSWSGRLGLVIASEPPQQFHAGFELTGSEQSGELQLTSPLGSILAVLQWRPGQALLRQDGERREYPSVDALSAAVTGTAVPVRALFAWLRGEPESVEGWHVDVSQLPDGRLLARRFAPLPTAELRIILDRS